MERYQRQSLILVIAFSVLSLLSGRAALTAFAGGGRPEPAATSALAGLTFTVNSTADPGSGTCDATECTLREAITAANAAAGSDTIDFNIPGAGPHTITPVSPLPTITSPVLIDGYTQPGASMNTLADADNAVLMIELNGPLSSALNLIHISAGSSTVRGLVINRCSRAIAMDTNGGNTIEGNFLGTNVAGSAISLNDYGVLISLGASNNLIGGTTPAARNLISGNNFGVGLQGGPSTVQGNFIGTDHSGGNDLGNTIGVSVVASNGNTIGGTAAGARNVISGNNTGIRMQASNNVIQGNYIGVNAMGGAFNNSNLSAFGVVILNSTGNTVGGATPAARNVISGHNIGFSLNADSTTIQGNYIGTDAAGTTALGNTSTGISVVQSNNTVIGGTAPGAGNLISGNGTGLDISPSTTGINLQVQGNLIGTDVNGTADLGNTGDGVTFNDAAARAGTNITIGGTAAGAGNVISGNNGDGIDLRAVMGVVVQGNLIGTQVDGTSPLGNSGHGINIVGAANNTIGGTAPGAGNRIAFNGAALNSGGGIIIDGSGANNNPLRGNSIFSNTSNGTIANRGLGIDLSLSGSGNGPTLNDACDGDTGPNNLQNTPVITSAITSGGSTTIQGTLDSTAATTFTIDLYSNATPDPSGRGEGETYLGSTTAVSSGGCNYTFSFVPSSPVTLLHVITATATDPSGNTSEFSNTRIVFPPTAAPANISGQVIISSGGPLSGVLITLTGGNKQRSTMTSSNGVYRFSDVATEEFYTVTTARANYFFDPRDRSFTLLGNKTGVDFLAYPLPQTINPLDTQEFFVRQQYLDFLGREPDQGGFDYWSNLINECHGNPGCIHARRIGVAGAFFVEQEFQETGLFIYGLYKAGLGRQPVYAEFAADRQSVVGGPDLEDQKAAFAEAFVQRTKFLDQYKESTTAESFVDALLRTVRQSSGVDLGAERANLVNRYNSGDSLSRRRSLVLREVAENSAFIDAEYNAAFVLAEYFGYLRRDPEPEGYAFWLDVLNNRAPGNYRGMICSFITSTEYQRRFSSIVTHSNAECAQ